jgi:chromosome segregation ATPase
MADILEDQRIHNIVKDYKRMYEQHDQLVAIGKEFQKQLIAKEKELSAVKAELEDVKKKIKSALDDKPPKTIKGQLCDLETQLSSVTKNILIQAKRLESVSEKVKQIKELLKL